MSTNAGNIAECAVQCALDALRDDALPKITRDEYFTYLTPDGELFDKSVLPGYVCFSYLIRYSYF